MSRTKQRKLAAYNEGFRIGASGQYRLVGNVTPLRELGTHAHKRPWRQGFADGQKQFRKKQQEMKKVPLFQRPRVRKISIIILDVIAFGLIIAAIIYSINK